MQVKCLAQSPAKGTAQQLIVESACGPLASTQLFSEPNSPWPASPPSHHPASCKAQTLLPWKQTHSSHREQHAETESQQIVKLWQLESSHGRSIYTTESGKQYKLGHHKKPVQQYTTTRLHSCCLPALSKCPAPVLCLSQACQPPNQTLTPPESHAASLFSLLLMASVPQATVPKPAFCLIFLHVNMRVLSLKLIFKPVKTETQLISFFLLVPIVPSTGLRTIEVFSKDSQQPAGRIAKVQDGNRRSTFWLSSATV